MLILRRKIGQSIVINGDIIVEVGGILRGKTVFQFHAPEETRIRPREPVREEEDYVEKKGHETGTTDFTIVRGLGEAVVINGDILVLPYKVDSNSTRIGIIAPREVDIMRSELLTEGQKPNSKERI